MMQDSSVKSQQETESKEVKDDVTEALEVQVKVKSLMPLRELLAKVSSYPRSVLLAVCCESRPGLLSL